MGHRSSKLDPGLSQEDLNFLMKNTNRSKKEIKEWYKGFLEDCPNGELSKEHLVEIYSQIFPGGNAEKFAEHVFGTFDTDRSGAIDFREFMLALHVTSCGTQEEKIRWAFRMYDIDGNGMIDITELKRTLVAVYEVVGEHNEAQDKLKAEELFRKLDENSDGEISQEEFINIIKQDHQLLNILEKT